MNCFGKKWRNRSIFKHLDLISLCTIKRNPWGLWMSNLHLTLLLLSCTCIHDAWCLNLIKTFSVNEILLIIMNCFVLRLFYSSLTQVEIQLIVNIDPLIAKETLRKFKGASISWLRNNHLFFYATLFWHLFLNIYFPQSVGGDHPFYKKWFLRLIIKIHSYNFYICTFISILICLVLRDSAFCLQVFVH